MSRIWTPQSCVPAAAITLATGLSNNQPILFTTQFGVKGEYKTGESSSVTELKWTIKSLEVTLVRDWNTSQAMIVLTCDLPENSPLPSLPDVSAFRGGNYPFLTSEDEIRIYAGYVESPSTPITADLLDEIPFDFKTSNDAEFLANRSKSLSPIFWGFIDKVELTGSSTGVQYVLSCRDRTRIFADTRVLSLNSLGAKNEATAAQTVSQATSGAVDQNIVNSFQSGDRVSVLLELANAAAGFNRGEASQVGCSCWKQIHQGPSPIFFDLNTGAVNNNAYTDPSMWTREAALIPMHDKSEPRFHVWAERPPINKASSNAPLQILNKTPLEVIDWMAKSEARPTDFYASHVNGDFVFGPRSIDMSGFRDPLRAYRTYFFRSWPKEMSATPPAPNQMIMSIRAVSSTMATFNKFVIVDSNTNRSNTALLEAVQTGFYSTPWQFGNRTPSVPCRTQIVYDGAIGTYPDANQGAHIIGMAASRIWARDVNGIQVELLGDPTWFPGEAIRVYGTGIHDTGIPVVVDAEAAEAHQTELNNVDAKATAQQVGELNANDIVKACEDNPASKLINKMMNENPGRVITDSGNIVLPVYKVRTIQHKITAGGGKRGWISVIQASADY